MKKLIQFAQTHTPTLVVLALVGAALIVYIHYWSDYSKAQSVGGFLSFAAAAILIGVTWEYVRINQRSLSLQQLQWEQQNRVVLRFGIKRYQGKAQLWVANIGRTDVLIVQLLIRPKGGEEIAKNERRVVRSGSRQTLALPESLWEGRALISAFDVRLRFESQHDLGESSAKAFTLLIGTSSDVVKIRRGIDDVWTLSCPKCKGFVCAMITENLANLDEAAKRQTIMEAELITSCPDHYSQWMDSIEQLRQRRASTDPAAHTED
jgi:hypothetical protein